MPTTSQARSPVTDHPMDARTLGFLLRETYAMLQEQVYHAAAAAGHRGLKAMHSTVLRHLGPDGGRVADLARATGMAKQSISYVVEDLVALGYLRIEPDPEDGRARRIRYTARGRKLLVDLMEASREAELMLARAIGTERIAALQKTLEQVLAARATRSQPAS